MTAPSSTGASGGILAMVVAVAALSSAVTTSGGATPLAASGTPRIELLAARGTISLPARWQHDPYTLAPASLRRIFENGTSCSSAPTQPLHELHFDNLPVWKPGSTGQRFPVFVLRVILPNAAQYNGDGFDGYTTGVIFRRQHGGLGEMTSGYFGDSRDACIVSLFAVVPWRTGPLLFQVTFPYHLPKQPQVVLGPLTITGSAR